MLIAERGLAHFAVVLAGAAPGETAAALKLPALDGAFEYGLACILDGAQKRLPGKHRGRS